MTVSSAPGAGGTDGVIAEEAPAKLNLYLHVLGRRPDGYHELDSLVAFADVGDTIGVRPADGLSLTIDGPFASSLAAEPASGNLVTRAARLLAESVGRSDPAVAITLTKRLPVASGIGGGSADAAATLRALARLWGLGADHPSLGPLAARLGADVPVCLTGRSAYFGGIGDIVDPAPPLPPCAVVLVNPGIPLSTPAVFKARSGPFSTAARLSGDRAPTDAAGFAGLLASRHNDLTAPALSLVPEIGTVLEALSSAPGCLLARLSGSGATCFALFGDEAAARAAAAKIKAAQPDWWVVPGKLFA
jgi:4-diphosphocytidyl-2-C-methyl-D-erythritol kinase